MFVSAVQKGGGRKKADKLLFCHQVNCIVTVSLTLGSSSPGGLSQFRYGKAVTLNEKGMTLLVTHDLLLIFLTTLGEGGPTPVGPEDLYSNLDFLVK